jgi:adenylate cyclase
MDWEAEGLLEGLEDDEHRQGRIELLDYLHGEGCEVAELKQAVAEDRLVLLPVERLLAGDKTYSQRQIADEAGLELDHLRRYRQALGLAVPDADAEVLGSADLEGAKDTAAIAAAGFSTEDTLEVTRVLGRGMVRYAEALRTLFAQTFLEPGDTELALARRLQSQAEELLPLSSRLLDHVFLLHLQQLLRNDVLGIAERTSGKVSDRTDTAVAFADLVGFTELGETVDVEELGGLAGRLSKDGERGGRAARARRQADRRRGDVRLPRRRGRRQHLPRADRARRGRGELPAAARRRRLRARPSTAGATGSARPSTSRAA